MTPVSVVIITKNEARHIVACIECARLISTDIIVVDAQSTDETALLAQKAGAYVIPVLWENFGSSRNTGAAKAVNNWILALDADERITCDMAEAILQPSQMDTGTIYGFKRANYFSGKKIRFGTWGRDKVFRLYHRGHYKWDQSPVHETLYGKNPSKRTLSGQLIHYPAANAAAFSEKIRRYAPLVAQKYFQQQKRPSLITVSLSPVFAFVQSYLLLLGFLDGKEGLIIAQLLKKYTRLKYEHLHRLCFFNNESGL